MNISLQQLRAFAALAREKNLTAAAASLFITKGAVSQAVRELEKTLGQPLFDRQHPHMYLNAEGRILRDRAEEILIRVDELSTVFEQPGQHWSSVRIGASLTIGNYLLPRLLAEYPQVSAELPGVDIRNTHDLCDAISEFALDVALIEGECHIPDLVFSPWLTDNMVIIARPGHALCERESVSFTDLAGEGWILREPLSGSREHFDHHVRPYLATMQEKLVMNTLEAVMSAVENGLGLSYVSELAARDRIREGRLAVLPVNEDFSRRFYIVWHRKKSSSAVLRQFVEYCLSIKSA